MPPKQKRRKTSRKIADDGELYWALLPDLRGLVIEYLSSHLYEYCLGATVLMRTLMMYNWCIPEIRAKASLEDLIYSEYFDDDAKRILGRAPTVLNWTALSIADGDINPQLCNYIISVYCSLLSSQNPQEKFAQLTQINIFNATIPVPWLSTPLCVTMNWTVFPWGIKLDEVQNLLKIQQTGVFHNPIPSPIEILASVDSSENIPSFAATAVFICKDENMHIKLGKDFKSPCIEKLRILCDNMCTACYRDMLCWMLRIYNKDAVKMSRAINYQHELDHTGLYKRCLVYGSVINLDVFCKIAENCCGVYTVTWNDVGVHFENGTIPYLKKVLTLGKKVYKISDGICRALAL